MSSITTEVLVKYIEKHAQEPQRLQWVPMPQQCVLPQQCVPYVIYIDTGALHLLLYEAPYDILQNLLTILSKLMNVKDIITAHMMHDIFINSLGDESVDYIDKYLGVLVLNGVNINSTRRLEAGIYKGETGGLLDTINYKYITSGPFMTPNETKYIDVLKLLIKYGYIFGKHKNEFKHKMTLYMNSRIRSAYPVRTTIDFLVTNKIRHFENMIVRKSPLQSFIISTNKTLHNDIYRHIHGFL